MLYLEELIVQAKITNMLLIRLIKGPGANLRDKAELVELLTSAGASSAMTAELLGYEPTSVATMKSVLKREVREADVHASTERPALAST